MFETSDHTRLWLAVGGKGGEASEGAFSTWNRTAQGPVGQGMGHLGAVACYSSVRAPYEEFSACATGLVEAFSSVRLGFGLPTFRSRCVVSAGNRVDVLTTSIIHHHLTAPRSNSGSRRRIASPPPSPSTLSIGSTSCY
jgi:hypothetical protein